MLRYDRFFEIVVFIAFWILLASALYMLFSFYVCDGHTCKPYTTANQAGPPQSKDYISTLIREMGQDGIWPLPYIGAAILTSLSLWFLGVPMTLKNFGILFFTSFVTIYFLFSFFIHHYLSTITEDISTYVEEGTNSNLKNDVKIDH